jgi:hypothetical protein
MSFEWARVYKSEDYFDQLITESALEYILEFYGVEELEELSYQHLKEIEEWVDTENPYIMGIGIRNVMHMLDSHLWEQDNG